MRGQERSYIGMFDSGVGGLTVMRQVMQRLPHESIIYFGDTARVPYGNKSRETVIRYSIENTIFLMERNIKLLIVACNTASAFAIHKLRQIFNIPIIGVIEPGAEKAAEVTRQQRIAVLGTKGTIQSGVYQNEIKRLLPQAIVIPVACPLFVPLVEERFIHHPMAELVVKEYLHSIRNQYVDTILLGCTHYPMLQFLIQKEVGADVQLIDSASTCAERAARTLKEYGLESQQHAATYHYYVSDDPEKFRELGESLFGHPLNHLEISSSSLLEVPS